MQLKNKFKPVIIIFLICLSLGLLTTSTMASMGSSKFSLVQSTQEGVEITFQMADADLVVEKISTSSGETYDQLSITGGGLLGEIGKPELPTLGTFLEIPEGAVPKMEIIASEYHDLSGYYVYPAQPPVELRETATFVKDTAAYGIDSFYPVQLVQFQEAGYIRTHRTAALSVCPALYNPVQKKLRIYTKIKVRIQYNFSSSQTRSSSVAPRTSDSPYFESLYEGLYLNYRQPEITTPTPDPTRSIIEDPNCGADYLIITHDRFKNSDALKRLAASKQKRGLRVYIRTLSDIGTNPDANQITAYIKNAYQTWRIRPTYLLLVGDTNLLPTHYKTRHVREDDGSTAWIPTDLYYSLMCGLTSSSPPDILPDIFVGRLPVEDEYELGNVVSKILNYEANFNPSDSWRNKCLTVYANDEAIGFNINANAISNFLNKEGYNCNKICFDNPSLFPSKRNQVIDAFNEEIFLVNFIAHGSYDGLWDSSNPSNPIFTINDINRIESQTALVFAMACNTGAYDMNDCLGESMLLKPTGVVGYIGSSRRALNIETEHLVYYFNEQLGRGKPQERLGQVLCGGKLSYFLWQRNIILDINKMEYWPKVHFELFNLLGDPEMTVIQQRSNLPSFSITAPAPGASLSKGSTYEIQWSWNTSISQVNLKLYKNGLKIKDITTVPCNGKYSWTVPLNLPDGNDYEILIEDASSYANNVSQKFIIITPEGITKQSEIEPFLFRMGDVNNDGFQDIIIPDLQKAKILLWNRNSGNWDIERYLDTGGNTPTNIQVVDANNDGYSDIVARCFGSVYMFLWNNVTGNWDPKVFPFSQLAMYVGDVNNDGYNDLVIGEKDNTFPSIDPTLPSTGKLKIFLWNNLLKNWNQPFEYNLLEKPPMEICIGDADNDGYQDIVMVMENATVTVLPSAGINGECIWKSAIVKPVGQSPYNLMIKDANNDGLNDIIVGGWQDFGTYMLLWDKNLVDWNPKTIHMEMYSLGYTIGDANNDGYNDLVICNRNYKKITEYLWNQQSGDWINSKTINLGNSPLTLNIADIDHDGFNDIITGNNSERGFSIILWKEPLAAVVLLPDSSSCWKTGGDYPIIWDSTNVWPGVVVELWKGNVRIREITASNIPCKFYSYYWQVPAEILEGKDYRIKVINPENPAEYGYSYIFEIAKATALGTAFQIKSPVANNQFIGGAACEITWETLSPVSKVKIDLWKGENLYREICTVLNTNNYKWNIPEYLPQGDDYRIKVSDADNLEQSVYSERFTIIPPSFMVTSSAIGKDWFMGVNYKITWQIKGFQPCNTVSIELWRWGQPFKAIATISNTGEYNWTVPKDLEGEGYSIKVYDAYRYDLDVCGYSETFNIVAPFGFTLFSYPRTTPDQLSPFRVEIGWRWTRIDGIIDTIVIELWEAPYLSEDNVKYWNENIQAGKKVDFNAWKKSTDLNLVRQIASYYIPFTRTMNPQYGYEWQLPEDLPNMRQCFIKITKKDDQSVYGLSPIFAIRFDHQLKVTKPAASELCLNGSNNCCEINWQWSGNVPSVNLELWNETDKVRDIAFNEPGNGSYYWSIPESAPSGSKYRIKIIEPNDPNSFGFGDYFEIRHPSLLDGIENEVIDADQPFSIVTLNLNLGTGQTFTADYTGYLNGVELLLRTEPEPAQMGVTSSELIVVIRDGAGLNGTVLGSSAPIIMDESSLQWYQFNLANVFIVKDSTYTIEVQRKYGSALWGVSYSNPYNGGFAYYPDAAHADNNAMFDWDFAFKTHVIPGNENELLDLTQTSVHNISALINEGTAQSFTAVSSGKLTGVDLLLHYDMMMPGLGEGEVKINIRSGSELNGLIIGSSLPVEVGMGDRWYRFNLDNIYIMKDQKYLIEVIKTGTSTVMWSGADNNPYTVGVAYHNKQRMDNWDYAFKTYVNLTQPSEYILTVIDDGNGNTNSLAQVIVNYGVSQEITATPKEGYRFINWTQTGGTGTVEFGNPNSSSTTVTVTGGDAMIRANFAVDLLGDVNGDGSVTINDALLTARFAAGENVPNFNQDLADVNRDGKLDINDATLISRFVAGLITGF